MRHARLRSMFAVGAILGSTLVLNAGPAIADPVGCEAALEPNYVAAASDQDFSLTIYHGEQLEPILGDLTDDSDPGLAGYNWLRFVEPSSLVHDHTSQSDSNWSVASSSDGSIRWEIDPVAEEAGYRGLGLGYMLQFAFESDVDDPATNSTVTLTVAGSTDDGGSTETCHAAEPGSLTLTICANGVTDGACS